MLSSGYPPAVSEDKVDISCCKSTVERTVAVGWRILGGSYMLLVHGQRDFHGHENGGISLDEGVAQLGGSKGLYMFMAHIATHREPCGSVTSEHSRVKSQARALENNLRISRARRPGSCHVFGSA